MGLYRSSNDKVIAGVCGGLAHKLGLNSTGFRIVFVIAALICGFFTLGAIIYILCWLLLPSRAT